MVNLDLLQNKINWNYGLNNLRVTDCPGVSDRPVSALLFPLTYASLSKIKKGIWYPPVVACTTICNSGENVFTDFQINCFYLFFFPPRLHYHASKHLFSTLLFTQMPFIWRKRCDSVLIAGHRHAPARFEWFRSTYIRICESEIGWYVHAMNLAFNLKG